MWNLKIKKKNRYHNNFLTRNERMFPIIPSGTIIGKYATFKAWPETRTKSDVTILLVISNIKSTNTYQPSSECFHVTLKTGY